MSVIPLDEAKDELDVMHDQDDGKIQRALNAAEGEALRYMERDYLPTIPIEQLSETESETDPVSESETPTEASEEIVPEVKQAIFILLRINYEGGDHAVRGALDVPTMRSRAIDLLFPFRRHIGP